MCYTTKKKRRETKERTFRWADLNGQNHIVFIPTHSKSLLFIKSNWANVQLEIERAKTSTDVSS